MWKWAFYSWIFALLVAGAVVFVAESPIFTGGQSADTIAVRIRGTTGTEQAQLSINGVVVATWNDVPSDDTTYIHQVEDSTTVADLRVHFLNDGVHDGVDKNLIIDHVKLNDDVLQSEDPINPSAGRWTHGDGCGEGFKKTEVLHCNGWISYTAAVGTRLEPAPDPPVEPAEPPLVILDTDMGPDIDDALALSMLHAYQSDGLATIAAVTVSRNSTYGARTADLINTFYGRPDIPIGIFDGTTSQDAADVNWSMPVAESGRYPHDVHLGGAVEPAVRVMRQVLADAPDGSVVIVQIGFSVNSQALLDSGPDDISPLTGRQLIDDKVSVLSIMAGNNISTNPEFNVEHHVDSARAVFEEWPTDILQTETHLGYEILYPASSIQNDFNYVDAHPIKEAYLATDLSWHDDAGDTYNMRTWDLHSVMAAVEPVEAYYRPLEPGRVTVDPDGRTRFAPAADGNLRSLGHASQYSADEVQAMVDRMVELVARPPSSP